MHKEKMHCIILKPGGRVITRCFQDHQFLYTFKEVHSHTLYEHQLL